VAQEEPGQFEFGTDGPEEILVGVDDSTTSLRAAAYGDQVTVGRRSIWRRGIRFPPSYRTSLVGLPAEK